MLKFRWIVAFLLILAPGVGWGQTTIWQDCFAEGSACYYCNMNLEDSACYEDFRCSTYNQAWPGECIQQRFGMDGDYQCTNFTVEHGWWVRVPDSPQTQSISVPNGWCTQTRTRNRDQCNISGPNWSAWTPNPCNIANWCNVGFYLSGGVCHRCPCKDGGQGCGEGTASNPRGTSLGGSGGINICFIPNGTYTDTAGTYTISNAGPGPNPPNNNCRWI